jgi:hypothetical protein
MYIHILSICNTEENNRKFVSYESVTPPTEQLDLTDVRILMPMYLINRSDLFTIEEISNATKLLSSKTEKALNCTVTFELTETGKYLSQMENAAAAGISYDIVFLIPSSSNENEGAFQFDKDIFLYRPWVEKGLIKDITEDVKKYFPKGIVYTELIDNAKDPNGRIYAIPKVTKVFAAYGVLCTQEVLEKYGREEINGYADFINLIESNLDREDRLYVKLNFGQFLNIYLQDTKRVPVSGSIIYDRNNGTVSYLEDTEVPETVFTKYKQYCDMGIIDYKNSILQGYEDIYVHEYMDFKSSTGYLYIPHFADTVKDRSLLLIGGINNDLYYYTSSSAMAIFTTSRQTERALMLLELLNSGNREFSDILRFGVEDRHYKVTEDKKIDLIGSLDIKQLFWGDPLLNYDSEAIAPFAFEENADDWTVCMLNEVNKKTGYKEARKAIFTMYRYMPDEIKALAEKRALPYGTEILEYFQRDDGINEILNKLQENRDERLFNWVKDYLTPNS